MKPKFRYISDLHLPNSVRHITEAFPDTVENLANHEYESEDFLILAGDIAEIETGFDTFKLYIDMMIERFRKVIFVPGNHEYYGGDIDEINEMLIEYGKRERNFIPLINDTYQPYAGIRIIGTTLWSDFFQEDPLCEFQCERMINDFHLIEKNGVRYRPNQAVKDFHWNFDFIRRQTKLAHANDEKIIIVTHHAPSFNSVSGRYRGSIINGAFGSDLSKWIIHNKPDVWIHGHMHNTSKYYIGKTRILCNPRGYATVMNRDYDSTSYFWV